MNDNKEVKENGKSSNNFRSIPSKILFELTYSQ